MLILEEHQIDPCRVIKRQENGVQAFPGAAFQNKLFRRLKQFPSQGREDAIRTARQHYLDTHGKFLVLVVQEESAVSVWGEDTTLERSGAAKTGKAAFIQTLDLEKLVGQMRNIGGVAIKDRRYGLKSYPRCFVGQEAAAWFRTTFELNHEEAVQLGRRLVEEKVIHHVTDDHGFEDSELFYRFYWDEN